MSDTVRFSYNNISLRIGSINKVTKSLLVCVNLIFMLLALGEVFDQLNFQTMGVGDKEKADMRGKLKRSQIDFKFRNAVDIVEESARLLGGLNSGDDFFDLIKFRDRHRLRRRA
ncbi:hypothetical protein DSECCO2_200380 [anaerobic digester metagenome]